MFHTDSSNKSFGQSIVPECVISEEKQSRVCRLFVLVLSSVRHLHCKRSFRLKYSGLFHSTRDVSLSRNDRSCPLTMRFPTLEMYLALHHKMLRSQIAGTDEMDNGDTKSNTVYCTHTVP